MGSAKLGDGTTLIAVDRKGNGLADFHAKEAVGEVRVPKPVRKKLEDYHGITKEAARWIGEVTYTANHRPEAPFRDSVASRFHAGTAKVGRAKSKGLKIKNVTGPRPVSSSGHAIIRGNGLDPCSICRQSSSKP